MKSSTGNAVMVCLNLQSLQTHIRILVLLLSYQIVCLSFAGRGQPAVGAPAPGGAQRPVSYL